MGRAGAWSGWRQHSGHGSEGKVQPCLSRLYSQGKPEALTALLRFFQSVSSRLKLQKWPGVWILEVHKQGTCSRPLAFKEEEVNWPSLRKDSLCRLREGIWVLLLSSLSKQGNACWRPKKPLTCCLHLKPKTGSEVNSRVPWAICRQPPPPLVYGPQKSAPEL